MNLILFEPHELGRPLAQADPRVRHVAEILRQNAGTTFDAGLINGPRGKAALRPINSEAVEIEFTAIAEPPPLAPITLIVGLPRPQTARDILREATTLGVSALHFVLTEKGDPNYARSTLWQNEAWRRQMLVGAEQAFSTRLPLLSHGRALGEVLPMAGPSHACCALDNYESAHPLSRIELATAEVTLAIGAERGWSSGERTLLRQHGFVLAHLGDRVLRTETACVAAITLVKAKLGLM